MATCDETALHFPAQGFYIGVDDGELGRVLLVVSDGSVSAQLMQEECLYLVLDEIVKGIDAAVGIGEGRVPFVFYGVEVVVDVQLVHALVNGFGTVHLVEQHLPDVAF